MYSTQSDVCVGVCVCDSVCVCVCVCVYLFTKIEVLQILMYNLCLPLFRAARAQRNGWFDAEIVPVKTKIKDKSGQEKEVLVSVLGVFLQLEVSLEKI